MGNGTVCRGRLAWCLRGELRAASLPGLPVFMGQTLFAMMVAEPGQGSVPGLSPGEGTGQQRRRKNALSLHFGLNAKGMPLGQGHGSTTVYGSVWLCLSA